MGNKTKFKEIVLGKFLFKEPMLCNNLVFCKKKKIKKNSWPTKNSCLEELTGQTTILAKKNIAEITIPKKLLDEKNQAKKWW